MSNQSTQPDKKVLGELHDALIKGGKNTTCLYPGCGEKPIGSHIIPERILKLIADKSEVLTWNPSFTSIRKNLEAGLTVEQLYLEPTAVGLNTVTYPLFCGNHDSTVFAPLEKVEFSSQSEQILLLAYRALCAISYRPPPIEQFLTIAERHGHRHTLSLPEPSARLQRYLARDILLEARQRHEQILLAHNYNQLGWAIYPVNIQPCIACTYAFVPYDDIEAKDIRNGLQALTAEDVFVFSLFPHKPLNNHVCVISWLRGSQRAQRVFHLKRINELSEQEQQDVLLSTAFRSNHVYLSPSWWNSLSEEQRRYYVELSLATSKEFSQSFYPYFEGERGSDVER